MTSVNLTHPPILSRLSLRPSSGSAAFALSLAVSSILALITGVTAFKSLILQCQLEFNLISEASAQSPLDEITMRPKNRWLTTKSMVVLPKRPSDLDPDSAYWSIFESEESPKIMVGWLGSPSAEFNYIGSSGKLKPYLSVATLAYGMQHSKRAEFFIRVIVPFPETSSIEGIKLVPALNKFQPPYLAVEAVKPIEIAGLKGRIFYEADNECSIHLPIARDGIIFATTHRCKDLTHLERLLRQLNINRLQQKLLS